jgi:hypothetical protein
VAVLDLAVAAINVGCGPGEHFVMARGTRFERALQLAVSGNPSM